MTDLLESNGPDPCNKNLRCQDFHDSLGQRAGSGSGSGGVDALGGCYNCCCCDPCRFVRPFRIADIEHDERNCCCRCVPRGMFLRFIPNAPAAECCRQVGVAMFNEQTGGDYCHTQYLGTLFGVDVDVEVGNVIGSGDEADLGCGWRITTTVGGSGSGSGDTQTFEIDHGDTSCLYVPTGVELAEVEGPDGCMGTLVLDDLEKARLPFLERDLTASWDEPNFIDISDNPCGTCEQVCAVICATGQRHVVGSRERVEFTWFDDSGSGSGSGSGGGADRGWSYVNADDFTERLLLSTDESGNCVITPDLESGAEIMSPVIVDSTRLCSCKMAVTFNSQEHDNAVFTARCGFCSCWGFVCGTCRCVPYELCVLLYVDETMYTDLKAIWNPDDYSWDVDTGGSGTYLLRLYLREDDDGHCIIEPEVNGVDIALENPPQFGCGAETVDGLFTGEHDTLSVFVEEEIDGGSGSGSSDLLMITASSLMPSCELGTCIEATPCVANCGSHPQELNVHIRFWEEPGDNSGGDSWECTWDIPVYYWQTAAYVAGQGMIYRCGYIGYTAPCDGCRVRVEVRNGWVTLAALPFGGDCQQPTPSYRLTTETCDPYYGDTGELLDGFSSLPDYSCKGCNTYAHRGRVTVTE